MVDHTRRRRYKYDRVLIESDRILTAQFDDAVIYLTGAQLEMLRNVSQYLRNLKTYVSAYEPGYYLTPDASDYDDILAIVADLEETLMGNPNTIWGYSDVWEDWSNWASPPAGYISLTLDDVEPGKVVRLEGVSFKNEDSVLDRLLISVRRSGRVWPMVDITDPAAGVWHCYSFDRTLEESDDIQFEVWGVVQNDDLTWCAWGREMDIPT